MNLAELVRVFLIVKPENQALAKAAIKRLPDVKLLIDRHDDQTPLENRVFAIGSKQELGELGTRCEVLTCLEELPNLTESSHILAKVYLPDHMKEAAAQLERNSNVVCYTYQPHKVFNYCVGNDPHILALSASLNAVHLNDPSNLRGKSHICEPVEVNIYCMREDEAAVLREI